VTLTDSTTSRRRDVLLGQYDTQASRLEYHRVLTEWEARGRRLLGPAAAEPQDLTITELIERCWRHVEAYYVHADKTPTGEVQAMRYALRPLNFLHGPTEARHFGPSALKAVRELWVTGYAHPTYGGKSTRPANTCCRTSFVAFACFRLRYSLS
jgi:hypothetical protein